MLVTLDTSSIDDYRLFLDIKKLPIYSFTGREAWFPDEYASQLGITTELDKPIEYTPKPFLFDYQKDIARWAIQKRKAAIFADCGLGKSLMYCEYARTVLEHLGTNRGVLMFAPLMVVKQMADEVKRFYGDSLPAEIVASSDLQTWLNSCGGKFGITNYEALKNEHTQGQLGCIIADESSVMKAHYGRYGQALIDLGKGLPFKLAGTGTPAPNDRIEYANHAVFLDQFPTINSFLAKYFVNRGQTQERWVLKPHALEPFYRGLSHWAVFLSNPAVYGWKHNADPLPPIEVIIHEVEMTKEQEAATRKLTGKLCASDPGGITTRNKLSKIAKGLEGSKTNKYEFICNLAKADPDESKIIWCWYNDEQDTLAEMLPGSASIDGATPHSKRVELIDAFKAGEIKTLISKPKLLGFGLNLQIAQQHIFSSLIDSYEQYYQAIKRSNRYGSTKPLKVHLPLLEIERPMAENVLRKAKMVQRDTEQQEAIFRAAKEGQSVYGVLANSGIDLETFCECSE